VPMHVCAELQSWPADARETFGRLRDAGVRHVALSWCSTPDDPWASALVAFGLSTAYLELRPLTCLTEDQFASQVEVTGTQLEAAKLAGAQRVGIASAHQGSIGFEMMAAAIARLVPLAERLGLRLCVRNRAGSAIEQLGDLHALLGRTKTAALRLCLDNVEFQRAIVNPADAVMSFADRLEVVRLRDEEGPGPCPLGRGRGHVAATGDALRTADFTGPIIIDVLGDATALPFVRAWIADRAGSENG